MQKQSKMLIFIGVVAACVVLSLLLTDSPSRSTKPSDDSSGTSKHELTSGEYTTTKAGAGANSLDNLAQMDECIRRSDQACETAMLLDGRAFLVEKGTMIDGQEIGYGVFEGTVHSGILVGKEIYIPVGAFK
jgi:hypothetical protein